LTLVEASQTRTLALPLDRADELCRTVLCTVGFDDQEVVDCTEAILFATRRGLDTVLLPGEREWREEQRRQTAGVPIDAGDWQALVAGLERAGLERSVIEAHAPDSL
jgi:LDH2 family malate/lactate/ureidoglycolate dehydrogenase